VHNLHPPIEAAASYLDVINARLDARRQVIEAEGKKQVSLLGAQTASNSASSSARVEGSRRVAQASSQIAEFTALGHDSFIAPSILRLRLWIEALESALAGQRLFLIDRSVLGEGGELLLDTRRYGATPLPAVELTPPVAPSGGKKRD
jgi:regulator of protease activity HflC (stomatin/prohibitin superfamily)